MRQIDHWIGGAEVASTSGRRTPVFNPATGLIQAEVGMASNEDVDTAVAVAGDAFGDWRSTSLSARSEIMFAFRHLVEAHTDDLASLVTAEHGKVHSDAVGEVTRGLENVEFACGIPNLLKGGFSEQVSTGIDVHSIRQPSAWWPASRRSTSPSWCRCGCSPTPSRAATPSS